MIFASYLDNAVYGNKNLHQIPVSMKSSFYILGSVVYVIDASYFKGYIISSFNSN